MNTTLDESRSGLLDSLLTKVDVGYPDLDSVRRRRFEGNQVV